MKKIVTIIALSGMLFLAAQTESYAQSEARTEGYELGVRNFYGASFAMPLGGNRLHASAAFNLQKPSDLHNRAFNVDVLYDWQFPAFGAGWFLFAGVGGSMEISSNFDIGVTGEFGVEYQFEFPLSLSADVRPTYYFTNSGDFSPYGGFEARWRF
jgi:hypothetical protein